MAELFSTLVNKEHNYVEVLLGKDEKRRLQVLKAGPSSWRGF